jgi:hypothetical protein
VKAGKYEIAGTADGYEPSEQEVEVGAGQVARSELRLKALPAAVQVAKRVVSLKDAFQRPEELEEKPGPWLTGTSSKFLDLRRAKKYDLTFLDPAATPGHYNGLTRRRPKLQWRIVVSPVDATTLFPNAEISYELEGNQLTRKVKADGKSTKATATANVADGQSAYSLSVVADGSGVRITARDGRVLDEFADARFDWTRAIVGVRGDTYFVVR